MVNKKKLKKKKKKKGFTLVELLAVIIILSLLMIVATSSVGKSLFNTKKKLLEVAAKKYYNEVYEELYSEYLLNGTITQPTCKTEGDYAYCISISDNKITKIIVENDGNQYITSSTFKSDITTGSKTELTGNVVSENESDYTIKDGKLLKTPTLKDNNIIRKNVPSDITILLFKANDTNCKSNSLGLNDNDAPICGKQSGNKYIVSTPANKIIATSLGSMFSPGSDSAYPNMKKIEEINFNNVLDTSKVTSMQSTFLLLSNLKKITFGENFDTSSVTNMSYMFQKNEKLEILDLSYFDTSNVTTMQNMFYNCKSITELKLGKNFDIDKVTTTNNGTLNTFYGVNSSNINAPDEVKEKLTEKFGITFN